MNGRMIEGLGLAALALFFGALMVYGAFVVGVQERYVRAAVYGALGLFGLYWGVRITLAELAGRGDRER